ncbi:MAG: TetR/AcrR family transcriptional repressor of nem operon [Oleiphilaceae bacterium]|jgi:TetR/AcrR family transcriptional repressor of nem operon
MMKNILKPKKSELTRSSLIEEGIQQLSKHGYHGTGIKQVLDAVKVPKGSFYNYFGSKEAYVAEIIAEYNHQALTMFDEFINQSELPALEQLKTIYEFMLNKFADNSCQKGCLVGSIAAEIGNTFELCQQAMQASVQDWLLRLESLVSKGQTEGTIRSDIPSNDLAELIWSAWEGSLLKMKMDGDIQSPKKIIYLTLNTLLKP